MDFLGIVDINDGKCDAKKVRELVFKGCDGGIENVETYGSSSCDRVCLTFAIVDVLCIDNLVTNVRRLTREANALRILTNGTDIDVGVLK